MAFFFAGVTTGVPLFGAFACGVAGERGARDDAGWRLGVEGAAFLTGLEGGDMFAIWEVFRFEGDEGARRGVAAAVGGPEDLLILCGS